MGLDGWLDAFGVHYLAPGCEAVLEGDDTGLGEGELCDLQNLLFAEAEVQSDPDVAIQVPLLARITVVLEMKINSFVLRSSLRSSRYAALRSSLVACNTSAQ